MQIYDWQQLTTTQQQALLCRPVAKQTSLTTQVSAIIRQVAEQGDTALLALTERYDGICPESLQVSAQTIAQAQQALPQQLIDAIDQAAAQIRRFHAAQQAQDITLETLPGVRCELRHEPLARVGLYIPGGSAPLISTVLMLGIPAQLAGCNQRMLMTPPPVHPAILYAASQCGIEQIYACGGAQAIAAMALGTETVPQVDKIFGPGNAWVTEAKRQLSQSSQTCLSIDMPAGPSEVLVIADATAKADFVAADLLSQAEHGADSQVLLITDSHTLAQNVASEVNAQLAALPRRDIAAMALAQSRIILVQDMTQATDLANQYAPEHLIIQTQTPRALLPQLRGAGSIFLGPYTPESVGDYASGTNHVLPTYGYARSVSSLSLADFSRRYTVQELSYQGLSTLADTVMTLAAAEQLDAHRNAVAIRLKGETL